MNPAIRPCLFVPLLAVLAACAPTSEDASPPHQDWIVESRVTFPDQGGSNARPPANTAMRLWVPYVVGDIYGSPNAGEITPVTLRPDLTFTLNLNLGYKKLARALVPTVFSQKWMNIEPTAARVARVSPFVLPRDGIAPFGMSEWLDEETGNRLLLIYVDRPARLRGEIVHQGRSLRFDITAAEAGYLWVRQPDGSGDYTAVPQPEHLVLAVVPNTL